MRPATNQACPARGPADAARIAPPLNACPDPAFAPKVENGDASPAGAPAAPVSDPSAVHFVSTPPLTARTGLPASAVPLSNRCVPPALASLKGYPSELPGPPIA